MKKISEKIIGDSYLKIYKLDEDIGCIDLIEKLQNLNYNINSIHIYENADLGMKRFEGNYSLEDFLELYKRVDKKEIHSIVIFIDNDISIILSSSNCIGLSSPENVEFGDIMLGKIQKYK